jgi:hypothetical protein
MSTKGLTECCVVEYFLQDLKLLVEPYSQYSKRQFCQTILKDLNYIDYLGQCLMERYFLFELVPRQC